MGTQTVIEVQPEATHAEVQTDVLNEIASAETAVQTDSGPATVPLARESTVRIVRIARMQRLQEERNQQERERQQVAAVQSVEVHAASSECPAKNSPCAVIHPQHQ